MVPSKMLFSMLVACFLGSVIVTHAQVPVPDCAHVQPGDGFIRIAKRCGIDPKQLVAANRSQRWYRNVRYVPQGIAVALPSAAATMSQVPGNALTPTQPQFDTRHLAEDLRVKRELANALTKQRAQEDEIAKLKTSLEQLRKDLEAAKNSSPPSPVPVGFTQEQMDEMRDKYELQLDRIAFALMIAIIAGIVFLVGIAVLAYLLWKERSRGKKESSSPLLLDLSSGKGEAKRATRTNPVQWSPLESPAKVAKSNVSEEGAIEQEEDQGSPQSEVPDTEIPNSALDEQQPPIPKPLVEESESPLPAAPDIEMPNSALDEQQPPIPKPLVEEAKGNVIVLKPLARTHIPQPKDVIEVSKDVTKESNQPVVVKEKVSAWTRYKEYYAFEFGVWWYKVRNRYWMQSGKNQLFLDMRIQSKRDKAMKARQHNGGEDQAA